MNFSHLHLVLNHFPIIGTVIGLGLFVGSCVGKNDDLKRASLMVFAAMALLALPTFFSGIGAQAAIRKDPAVSTVLIERHQGAAILALFFMEITGALALVGLSGAQESGLSAIVHVFEPSPGKLTDLMLTSKWWWAFMMDLHFIGLALLIGTVGILNLRMLGFAKPLPIAPLHRLMPWAMAGFGMNTVTGILAFIGMPNYYTFDVAFWLKMLALLLLGLNAAAFYLTDAFPSVEHLGPGEDAPPFAKVMAATSLVLWFAVIALGRYIQPFSDTISVQ